MHRIMSDRVSLGMRGAALAALVVAFWPAVACAQLTVLHSGGFAVPYRELLPAFERSSGVTVTSTLGASQGGGPTTIPSILRRGAAADVVIVSKEGLADLIAEGRIVPGTAVDLAQAPLGVAVRAGAPKPDISSVEAFKQVLLRARAVNLVSTTGIYLTETLFPRLGIGAEMARKANGSSVADLPNSPVDVVLRPVSEIVDVPGFVLVGAAPNEIQFVSVFTAAIVNGAQHPEAAKRLIAYLSSEAANVVARRHGMDVIEHR